MHLIAYSIFSLQCVHFNYDTVSAQKSEPISHNQGFVTFVMKKEVLGAVSSIEW